jgi:voltage-gated potassium channel Kch
MKTEKKLILLAILSLVATITGTIGFYQHEPESGILTSLYLTIQLFKVESGVVDNNPTPILIEVSRWLALAIVIGAVFTTLQTLLVHFQSWLRVLFIKNHTIICGAGMRGFILAKAFKKRGEVIVIDIDEKNSSIGELKNQDIHVITGNAMDATVLQKAGVHKASAIIAVTGHDDRNLSICFEVKEKLNHNCKLRAGVNSWPLRSYFLDRMNMDNKNQQTIVMDSYISRAARAIFLKIACKAIQEKNLRNNGIRILLDVCDEMQHEFLRAAISILQISGDIRPTIELTSTNYSSKKLFMDRFPESSIVANLRWHEESACQVFPEHSASEPDFAIFSASNDVETLELAERFWMRHNLSDDRCIACIHGNNDSGIVDQIQKKERDFHVLNFLEMGIGSNDPLEPDIESRAKICHAVYIRNEIKNNPNYGLSKSDLPTIWDKLPERIKESNRMTAMHHEVKRHAWHARGDEDPESILSHLAVCEHMRWMAEKAMDGWRWTQSDSKETRDNLKLKHHLLVPYDHLSNEEKVKDYNTFIWALELNENELTNLKISPEAKDSIKYAKRLAQV